MIFFYVIFLIKSIKNVQIRKDSPVLRIQKIHIIFLALTMLKSIKNCLYKYYAISNYVL